MQKVCVVILNYLNYEDTIACVDSILEMRYNLEGIIIVDNASNNNSFIVLHNLYYNNDKIIVVRANKNHGYARGNNIGIRIARKKFCAEFVFVVNNDTIFMQRDFFIKLLQNYEKGVGAIGPLIYLKDDNVQREFLQYVDFRNSVILYAQEFLTSIEKSIWINVLPELDISKRIQMLHGCAVMLTPDFFQYYEGFCKYTFLYYEEVLLYLMCKRYGLRMMFVKDAHIYHKREQSSGMSFSNSNKRIMRYSVKSHKYVLWWIIKNKFEELKKY